MQVKQLATAQLSKWKLLLPPAMIQVLHQNKPPNCIAYNKIPGKVSFSPLSLLMPQGAARTAQTIILHPCAGPAPSLGAETQPGMSAGSLLWYQPCTRCRGTGHPGTQEEGARAKSALAGAGYPLHYKCREVL